MVPLGRTWVRRTTLPANEIDSGHVCPSPMKLYIVANDWETIGGNNLNFEIWNLRNDGATIFLIWVINSMNVVPLEWVKLRNRRSNLFNCETAKKLFAGMGFTDPNIIKHGFPFAREKMTNVNKIWCLSVCAVVSIHEHYNPPWPRNTKPDWFASRIRKLHRLVWPNSLSLVCACCVTRHNAAPPNFALQQACQTFPTHDFINCATWRFAGQWHNGGPRRLDIQWMQKCSGYRTGPVWQQFL